MRILYLNTIRLDTDLCRSSRLGLIEGLVQSGCDVVLVAGYDLKRPAAPSGARLIAIPAPRIPYGKQLSFNIASHAILFWEILTWRPHAVLVDPYTFHCAFPWDLLSRWNLWPTKVVMDIRSGIFHSRHRGGRDLIRRAIRAVSLLYARHVFAGFTTISPMLRDILTRDFGIPTDRIGIWQSGVTLTSLEPTQRASSRATGEPFRVIYHGSFALDRGLEETIGAMHLLEKRGANIELFLLGTGTQEAALRSAAAGLKNVVFHPPVPHDEVPAFLEQANVGILPFKPTEVMRSSSPLKLMEYLAAARPVVASRIEAIEDVVGPDGAFYLQDQTPEAIAAALEEAARDPDRIRLLASRGTSIVSERFTWRRQAESLRDFLARIGQV